MLQLHVSKTFSLNFKQFQSLTGDNIVQIINGVLDTFKPEEREGGGREREREILVQWLAQKNLRLQISKRSGRQTAYI